MIATMLLAAVDTPGFLTPELITVIVAGVITIFAGPGLYGYLSRRKDQPIKETEVDITVATSINKVALDTLAAVGGISRELKEDLAKQNERLAEVESKLRAVQELNVQQDRQLSGWRLWYIGVQANWLVLRESDNPPQPPTGETIERNR